MKSEQSKNFKHFLLLTRRRKIGVIKNIYISFVFQNLVAAQVVTDSTKIGSP